MQLSDDQIQYLFRFTEKKFVHWYDLQLELVDHLASHIEEEMAADASLSFEAALQKVYKGFGIFGFAKIVQEKSAQIMKSARKIWWQELRTLFRWPRIALFVLTVPALWQLSSWVDNQVLMITCASIYLITGIVMLRKMYNPRKPNRRLMMMQYGSWSSCGGVVGYESYIFITYHDYSRIEFCIYAAMGIIIQFASYGSYNKVREKARQLYPAAFA